MNKVVPLRFSIKESKISEYMYSISKQVGSLYPNYIQVVLKNVQKVNSDCSYRLSVRLSIP